MFRELKRIWDEQAFTRKIVDEFSSMLDYSEEMLAYALKVIINKGKGKKSDKKIYFKDQKINVTEQEIRKRILVHLSTNPGGNLPASLSLIGLAKDAERLGDYVKNIFELNSIIRKFDDDDELFGKLFVETGNEVCSLFSSVKQSFRESDAALAKEAASKARTIAKQCEAVIDELLDSDLPTRKAVTLALGARYFKRIALHLANIASAIFLPLPEMDYINGILDEDD